MKLHAKLLKTFFYTLVFLNSASLFSQQDSIPKEKRVFWKHVQFGGGLGLAVGNGFTNISVSPTGYYNFNKTYSVGVGLTGSYVAQEQNPSNFNSIGYKSTIFGGSLIGLVHPIEEIQLSAELEELRVQRNFDDDFLYDDTFWNTALFLGAGYRAQNVTLGVKFNVLHKADNHVYSQAFVPFIRLMF
ncbi:MAG: hypothetical protein A3G95_00135 [Flavobacteria bacterium RIFCSPLOWO2_12_FULL_31_7]|nr:MAG: hypothetical protein A3G95_00135 [Flavobacteria bacterium RIFCSPLOWO2_12_FULL_31_7]